MRHPIKRMHLYTIQQFIPRLVVTILICWFVVLMQFLWQYVDDLVGKGLEMKIIAKSIFYAAIYIFPMSMPLGILLASLMTFGNLGERLELLAMKSAGVPLFKIMKPLIVLVFGCAVGLFFYVNYAQQNAAVKFYQIAFSSRFSRPELEIPTGIFFNGIDGISLYVEEKDHETGMLYDVMLYDNTGGFGVSKIIRCDSGLLTMDESRKFLTFNLYDGESFQNLKKSFTQKGDDDSNKPNSYLKEHFDEKMIVVMFDSNFDLMDDSYLQSQFVGKNVWELSTYSDSTYNVVDSLQAQGAGYMVKAIDSQVGVEYKTRLEQSSDSTFVRNAQMAKGSFDYDSLYLNGSIKDRLSGYEEALKKLNQVIEQSRTANRSYYYAYDDYVVNRQEFYRKMTIPVACILFFFIGAPLGAIIRKGGIGMPMVASVMVFVIYYMVDTSGLKLCKTGEWPVWAGMWLSSFVIIPLGIFLTYQATHDSAVLNPDAYLIGIKRFFSRSTERIIERKDIIIDPVSNTEAQKLLQALMESLQNIINHPYPKGKYFIRLIHLVDFNRRYRAFSEQLDCSIDRLADSPNKAVVSHLFSIPHLRKGYSRLIPRNKVLFYLLIALLPISIPLVIYWSTKLKGLRRNVHSIEESILDVRQALDES